jgi:hypothetical protein
MEMLLSFPLYFPPSKTSHRRLYAYINSLLSEYVVMKRILALHLLVLKIAVELTLFRGRMTPFS